jgi:hypothetical protein
VEFRVEGRVAGRFHTQRVEPSSPVPEVPDGPDVLDYPDDLLHVHPADGWRPPVRIQPGWAPGFEELSSPFIDRFGVPPVSLVELQHVAKVGPVELALGLSIQPDHTLTLRVSSTKKTSAAQEEARKQSASPQGVLLRGD